MNKTSALVTLFSNLRHLDVNNEWVNGFKAAFAEFEKMRSEFAALENKNAELLSRIRGAEMTIEHMAGGLLEEFPDE